MRGHLRRDRGRRHPGRAAQAARRRAARPGGGDRDHQLRRRAEDPRRGHPDHGPARPDQADPRSIPGGSAVTVQVRIPTILRSYTGGAPEVTTSEGTLREVIAGLDAAYPGLGGRILDDGGKLRRFVNVYVGAEDVRFAQGLDTEGAAGARVSFIPAVA